ncbi:MAG: glycosyltransferase [Shewanella sp.]
MRIIIPVLGMGRAGGERVLSKLASELVRLGNEVFFVTPMSNTGPYYSTTAKVIYSKKSDSRSKVIRFFLDIIYLWRACKDINADAVIANYHLTAYIASMLLTRKQRFYYVQAYEVNFSSNLFRKMIAYISYLLPLNIIVNSEALLPKMINKYNGFLTVIPAGIDYKLFYDEEMPSISGKINLGIIGRQEHYKGTKEILGILSKYILDNKLDERINVNVAVYMPEVEHKINSLRHYKISNDVELSNFYKINDIFIATGLIEDGAFHYPCAEAMTAGCLVISNYAPLCDTSSTLKLTTFSEIEINNALMKIFNLTPDEIAHEVSSNQAIMSTFAWNMVGVKMNSVLQSIK